jgi:hypothetical protein
MHTDIPEEIQGKLKILEKEKNFFKRMWAPSKWDIPTAVLGFICIVMLSIILTAGGYYNVIPVNFVLVIILIVHLFKLRKLYKLYANALDIINYYRSREAK